MIFEKTKSYLILYNNQAIFRQYSCLNGNMLKQIYLTQSQVENNDHIIIKAEVYTSLTSRLLGLTPSKNQHIEQWQQLSSEEEEHDGYDKTTSMI